MDLELVREVEKLGWFAAIEDDGKVTLWKRGGSKNEYLAQFPSPDAAYMFLRRYGGYLKG